MKSKIGSLEWLEDYLFDKLRQIKRNPRYVSFCRKVPFNDDGIGSSIESLLDTEADKVRNAFGLALTNGLIYPSMFRIVISMAKTQSGALILFTEPRGLQIA